MREGPRLGRGTLAVVNLSGRGDKDVAEVLRVTGRTPVS
jgi:tryptophan synthase beta subunit